MALLTASELGAIQSVAEQGMESLATILHRITIETANGQQSEWATVGDEVKCWVAEKTPIGGTLGAIAGGIGISEVFSIRMPVGTEVYSGDRIVVGSLTYVVEHTNVESTIVPWLECGCRAVE